MKLNTYENLSANEKSQRNAMIKELFPDNKIVEGEEMLKAAMRLAENGTILGTGEVIIYGVFSQAPHKYYDIMAFLFKKTNDTKKLSILNKEWMIGDPIHDGRKLLYEEGWDK